MAVVLLALIQLSYIHPCVFLVLLVCGLEFGVGELVGYQVLVVDRWLIDEL